MPRLRSRFYKMHAYDGGSATAVGGSSSSLELPEVFNTRPEYIILPSRGPVLSSVQLEICQI